MDDIEEEQDDFSYAPSPPPYDVSEKIKEANRLLREDSTPMEKLQSPKVKFKEQIVEFEVELSSVCSDEWFAPKESIPEAREPWHDESDSNTGDSEDGLIPLTEEVKRGFPHQAFYPDTNSPTDEQISDTQNVFLEVEQDIALELYSLAISSELPQPSSVSFLKGGGKAISKEGLGRCESAPDLANSSSESIRRCRSEKSKARPWTAPNNTRGPVRSKWQCPNLLPCYNGARSEYGLSQEQLEERQRKRLEFEEKRQQQLRKKQKEDARRREQNERVFNAWLTRKQVEWQQQRRERQRQCEANSPRAAMQLRRQQAEDCFNQWLQRKKVELQPKIALAAPSLTQPPKNAHRLWLRNKLKHGRKLKVAKRPALNDDPANLERILNAMDSRTQTTFRIYLQGTRQVPAHRRS